MNKLKYYSLSKDEKEKLKYNFYETEYGKSIKKRLDRLFVIGVLSLLFGIFLIIFHMNIWDIISGISLLLASILFIGGSFKIRIDKLNNFLIKQNKK